MTTMLAYHNDPLVKAKYLARMKHHILADQLLQGYDYWKNNKGCAVGCTLHSPYHQAYETELGIPEFLAHLEEYLFERLIPEEARSFPLRFLEAIPVGADLTRVGWQFKHWLLVDPNDGMINNLPPDKPRTPDQRQVLLLAAHLVEREMGIGDGRPTALEWFGLDDAVLRLARKEEKCGPVRDALYVACDLWKENHFPRMADHAVDSTAYTRALPLLPGPNPGDGEGGGALAYVAFETAHSAAQKDCLARQAEKLLELLAASGPESGFGSGQHDLVVRSEHEPAPELLELESEGRKQLELAGRR